MRLHYRPAKATGRRTHSSPVAIVLYCSLTLSLVMGSLLAGVAIASVAGPLTGTLAVGGAVLGACGAPVVARSCIRAATAVAVPLVVPAPSVLDGD